MHRYEYRYLVWVSEMIESFCIISTEIFSVFTDYIPAPDPNKPVLNISKGQERDCTNITILDDILVETVEEFNVTLSPLSNTFGAGVTITREVATVEIEDDDGIVSVMLHIHVVCTALHIDKSPSISFSLSSLSL